ncbi:MAG: CNNM domain-containing protein [Chitinispirillaceae bacterium]
MTTVVILSVFTVLFLLFSAFFSASETALFSIPRERILAFQNDSVRSRRLIHSLLADGHRTLLLILLGNMFVNITLAGLIQSLLEAVLNRSATGLSLLAATAVIIVFGEIFPKNTALGNNEKIAAIIAPYFHYLKKISAPLLGVIQKLNQVFLTRLKVHFRRPSPFVTVDELKSAIYSSARRGAISQWEQDVVIGLLDKGAQPVKRFMLHRSQVLILPQGTMAGKALVRMSRHGRPFVLVSNRNQQIKGVVRLPDLFKAPPKTTLGKLSAIPEWVPETLEVADLITFMYSKDLSEVCVLDEFGGFAGVFSLAGGLRKVMHFPRQVKKPLHENGTRTKVFSGLQDTENLGDWLPPELAEMSEDVATLNGVLTRFLGRIPKTGDRFAIGGWNFYIIKSGPTKVETVLIRKGMKE